MKRMLLLIGSFILHTTAWTGEIIEIQEKIVQALHPIVLPEKSTKLISEYATTAIWKKWAERPTSDKVTLLHACRRKRENDSSFLVVAQDPCEKEIIHPINLMPYKITEKLIIAPSVYTLKLHTRPIAEFVYSPHYDILISAEGISPEHAAIPDRRIGQNISLLKINNPPCKPSTLQGMIFHSADYAEQGSIFDSKRGFIFKLQLSPHEQFCAGIQLVCHQSGIGYDTKIALLSLKKHSARIKAEIPNYKAETIAWENNNTILLYGIAYPPDTTPHFSIILFDLKKKQQVYVVNTANYMPIIYMPRHKCFYGYDPVHQDINIVSPVSGKPIYKIDNNCSEILQKLIILPDDERPDDEWVLRITTQEAPDHWIPAAKNTEIAAFLLSPKHLGIFDPTKKSHPLHILEHCYAKRSSPTY